MNILDTTSDWDHTKPWCTVEQRDAAVAALMANPKVDKVALFRRLSQDFALFCQLCLSTHDPRRTPAWMPFKLWDYQVKIGRCMSWAIENAKDLLCEKSRDVGASWVFGAWDLWNWGLADDFHALITSRKKEMIDSRDEPDTLFERMRMMLKRMPPHLKDILLPGFNLREHATFARLINPRTGNTITGEPPVDTFGRAGRYTCCQYDEAAYMARLKAMRAAAGDAARTHMYFTTPNGMAGEFWNMRQEAIKTGNRPLITVHWSVHPLKRVGLYVAGDDALMSGLADLQKRIEGNDGQS